MCGIAGIAGSKDDYGIDPTLIRRMCRTLVHRGPDDEGIFVKAGVGLGMRRLGILDLPGGHQPLFNEDRTVWIVFNGEIYNFRELRQELEVRGHQFQSKSDTEVIVHLYEEEGSNCVHRLRGMFAFALFDEKNRYLLLGRDRLGKKPLHYAVSGERIFFASEIKAILAAAPQLASLDQEALLEYFYFGHIPDPATAFLGIRKLPPGHLLEYENGEARVRQYWDLPEYGTYSPASEEECLEQLEEKLSEAVRLRLVADVPLGAFLSGGTDSSTIVALMARASSKPVKTFSVGFEEADFDEAPFARKVAEKFGTEHHEVVLRLNILETIERLASSLEEPFGDSSVLPTYYVSSLARKFVTVVLSGDGGDEAFAGYDRYRIHLQQRAKFQVPDFVGRFYRQQVYPRLPRALSGRNVAYSVSLPWSERYLEAVSILPYQRNYSLFSEDYLRSAASCPLDVFRTYLGRDGSDPLSSVLYLDTKTYLPGDILTKVDRMSMAASLEARVPMLDHILLEWVTSLSPKWKMRKGGQKYILIKLAERLGVPSEVLNRPKKGFAVPLVHWMRHQLKNLVHDLLLDPATLQRGYFNEKGIRHLLEDFFRGRCNDDLPIWRLMMFEMWHRHFLAKIPKAYEDHPASLGATSVQGVV